MMAWEIAASTAWWFLPFVTPVALWVAWSDLARMKIPNKAVLTLVAIFAIVGLFALPLDVWAWRWLHLALVLVAGFILSSVGAMGAGDAKFAAAMAPFIAPGDAVAFAYLLSATLLAAYLLHRLMRAIPAITAATANWESWQRKRDFPAGLGLGPALVFYLIAGIVSG